MDDSTRHEASLYGNGWHKIHNGYFSDKSVAAPLVDAIVSAILEKRPSAVADMGGGTGFLLGEVLKGHDQADCAFINVDISEEQLGAVSHPGITGVARAVQKVSRDDLLAGDGSLLLCMRSILHYFGRDGIRPILEHFRSIMDGGELLVHQTACFEKEEEGRPLNLLYELIGTNKWYPTVKQLSGALEDAGLRVLSIEDAPTLPLGSDELQERYRVSDFDMTRLEQDIVRLCGTPRSFVTGEEGFTAYLDYKVYRCVAYP